MLPLRVRGDLGVMPLKGVLPNSPSSSITRTSPSDCLASYPIISLRGWGSVLPLCREPVGVFYRPSRLGNKQLFLFYFMHINPCWVIWCMSTFFGYIMDVNLFLDYIMTANACWVILCWSTFFVFFMTVNHFWVILWKSTLLRIV